MIEEFIVKLEDGREIKIAGELLDVRIPEELVEAIKSLTFAELLVKMSEQIAGMRTDNADN